MAVLVTGYTLKQFFDDERVWSGQESYQDVRFDFPAAPEGFVDPLTIPDGIECMVSGGHYQVPGKPDQCFEVLLAQWLEKAATAHLVLDLPRETAVLLQEWLGSHGLEKPTLSFCR